MQVASVNTIKLNCNITTGAYYNNIPSHTIYECPINIPSRYALQEIIANNIFSPINTPCIENITLTVYGQDENLVNFQAEKIVVRLQLKQF